jgi:hypothetical protein
MSKSIQPFYTLRPNKYIDRQLFAYILSRLSGVFPLDTYHYIGFGSYIFEDFKLLHNNLHITKMTSLEIDDRIYERAKFNRPLSCIEIVNQSCTDYLNEFTHDESNIIAWLDFVEPSMIGEQFADYCSLLRLAKVGDIVRITLNANPATLDGKDRYKDENELRETRLKTLTSRISQYFSEPQPKPEQITQAGYPLLLLSCLKKATMTELIDNKFDRRFLLPLCCNVYSDGQQMLTFTGIILSEHSQQEEIKMRINAPSILFCGWDKLNYIRVPPLSEKELLTINGLLPNEESFVDECNEFSFVFREEQDVIEYSRYYKYYPNFRHVSL